MEEHQAVLRQRQPCDVCPNVSVRLRTAAVPADPEPAAPPSVSRARISATETESSTETAELGAKNMSLSNVLVANPGTVNLDCLVCSRPVRPRVSLTALP